MFRAGLSAARWQPSPIAQQLTNLRLFRVSATLHEVSIAMNCSSIIQQ